MRNKFFWMASSAMVLFLASDVYGWGFRGGGGGGFRGGGISRPSGGGISRPSGGFSRPQTMPSRPSMPSLGSSRPTSRPSVSQPTSRPSFSRPSVSQPSTSRPNISRPSGGFNPSTTRPSTRPQVINNRPTTLPGNTRPNIGGNRPTTLPGNTRPNIGGNRPTTLPGNTRPNIGGNRPTTLPGNTRPSLPNLGGGNRPNLPNIGGGNRPNLPNIGGGNHPSAGSVGDFLGMDRPLKPGSGNTVINRPNINRPNINNPTVINRPNTNIGSGIKNSNIGGGIKNSNIGNRVNVGVNRPININTINRGNRVINNRPTWANISNNRVSSINNRWNSRIGGLRNWPTRHPQRTAYWRGWGNGVRSHYGHYRNFRCFDNVWWNGHHHGLCGWHYGYAFNRYPWQYWWRVPTYTAVANWFTWTAPQTVWSEPIYYDYGTGGNVVYQDNSVSIDGEQVASTTEFAQSAAVLASVQPPANEEAAQNAEWMPLGTFAVSANEKDVNPTRVIQLAVDRQGVISGTLYNTETDEAQTVQGQVDKETQRVAFRIGESEDIVAECGLYNLTQNEAPLLVHYGASKVENYLLVRLEQDDANADNTQTPPQ